MKLTETKIKDLYIIEPKVFGDDRGYFMESFKESWFKEHFPDIHFIQDNESRSSYGVLRGLHYQKPPFAQTKLVRVIQGEVLDVAVDLRKDSPTYGEHVSVILSGENKKQFLIPKGFAHGFVVLSEEAVFSYKVDNEYAPDYDDGIIWNDRHLNIDWKLIEEELILSEKDRRLSEFLKGNKPSTVDED
ncbi:dTDP-4-dehydrorhamnose 3,5-epimerase [Robertkochia sediminum]|uniref:dTDP-4-dehydrorhamnose 3,5-epimerase n=1 Tax=Robertkochia sediminum TaxID=2785326 RepID=UPI001931FC8A|nr:dTDP-4-dehydrorhamnose 3,5-epimerase [Robertkochia sediminum]MBL7473745.1 dTDP-4-dehydrorhamnose 3,5-epimerase [Robertkochia sediminum]